MPGAALQVHRPSGQAPLSRGIVDCRSAGGPASRIYAQIARAKRSRILLMRVQYGQDTQSRHRTKSKKARRVSQTAGLRCTRTLPVGTGTCEMSYRSEDLADR